MRLPRIQFTVRWLLVAVAVAAVPLAIIVRENRRRVEQERAIAAVVRLGGEIGVNYTRGQFDVKRRPVVFIAFTGPKVTDTRLALLRPNLDLLPELESLDLGGTKITDAGMVHLTGLKNLRDLVLWDTEITDAGLDQLKGLKRLEILNLNGTKVTSSGIIRLKELKNLRGLELSETKIGDADLAFLAHELKSQKYWTHLEWIGLNKTSAHVSSLVVASARHLVGWALLPL